MLTLEAEQERLLRSLEVMADGNAMKKLKRFLPIRDRLVHTASAVCRKPTPVVFHPDVPRFKLPPQTLQQQLKDQNLHYNLQSRRHSSRHPMKMTNRGV